MHNPEFDSVPPEVGHEAAHDAADDASHDASGHTAGEAEPTPASGTPEAAVVPAPEGVDVEATELQAAEVEPANAEAPPEVETITPAEAAVAELSPAQCSARLAELFPALFCLQQPLPLKLRVQADIQARAPGVFTRKGLSGFLHRYTTGTPYLLALTRQTQRFDLDGQPAGEVAAEHLEAATTELARRRAIVDARRVQERAAQRTAQKEAEASNRLEHEKQQAQQAEQAKQQQGQRERALLLRAFETSTLTRANFCALKGLAEADLEQQLVRAREEAATRAQHQAGSHPHPHEPTRDAAHAKPRREDHRKGTGGQRRGGEQPTARRRPGR